MIKNCIVLFDTNGEPYELLEVKTFQNINEFNDFQKVCDLNKTKKIAREHEKEEYIGVLADRLLQVESELAYNRGELTEKEYKAICGKK